MPHALYVACREQIGREASQGGCILDSQRVKSTEKGPASIPHCDNAALKPLGDDRVIDGAGITNCSRFFDLAGYIDGVLSSGLREGKEFAQRRSF
jgi:hypothetical protein